MVEFIMMVGVSGSGKSFFANNYRRNKNPRAQVLDSDDLREELFGDRYDQTHNDKVFEEMERRAIHYLQEGFPVVYCATNLSYRRRANLLKKLKTKTEDVHFICILLNTMMETCYERNWFREHPVPDYVIDRQARTLQMPLWSEGWDDIQVVRGEEWDNNYEDYFLCSTWDKAAELENQMNHHHHYSLITHCKLTADAMDEMYGSNDMVAAALWHDLGKAYTKHFSADGEMHYPGHDCVGVIYALNYFNNLHIAQLICYHMKPYAGLQERMCWEKRCGQALWNEIVKLHEADERAH